MNNLIPSAPTPPRRRQISYDPSVISRHLQAGLGSMQNQKNSERRKSSIPFADRAPKVRFLRQVEPHSENEHGKHEPVIPIEEKVDDKAKTILKHTDFPILIDQESLESGIPRDAQTTNEDLEGCINSAEQVIQCFKKAEREARGAVDILTFPVATGHTEPLSRFEGSLIIVVLAMNHLPQEDPTNEEKRFIEKVSKLTDDLLNAIKKGTEHAKSLLKKVSRRNKEWAKLLSRKGEFKVEHPIAKMPIYTKNKMPEYVTMYEDVLEEDMRYKFDGILSIYRVSQNIVLSTDIRKNIYTKYPEEIEENQLFTVAEYVLAHAKDLIDYASKNLDTSLAALNDQTFDAAFAKVYDRIVNVEFDAFFDPLCALELKNMLGDVVVRKSELLNAAEHIVTFFKWMSELTNNFRKFCKKVAKEQITQKPSRGECCGLIKPMTSERLLKRFPGIGTRDFMVTIPLTERVQSIVFSVKPSELTLSENRSKSTTKTYI